MLLRYRPKNFITSFASYYIIGFITFKMAKFIMLLASIMLFAIITLLIATYVIKNDFCMVA